MMHEQKLKEIFGVAVQFQKDAESKPSVRRLSSHLGLKVQFWPS